MTRSPRIAVIGAGAWGINHVRALASEPGCAITTVGELDPAAVDRVARVAPWARVVEGHEPVLADPDVDAVVIATPAATHADLACAALGAGKHVLIEKPLALTLPDAVRVTEAARQAGGIAMVGHLMVFHPAVTWMKARLQAGALGRLHYVHGIRANLGRIRSDENALWSFGPHDLSMLDFLLEKAPVSVAARGQCVLQQGVEDVVFLSLRYATGEMAHLHLSWLHPHKERRLTMVCEHKMLEFDDVAADKLRIYDKGYDRPPGFTEFGEYLTIRDGDVHMPHITMDEPLRVELRHFIRCIQRGSAPLASIDSGLRVTRVLDAAQRSLRDDGVPVAIAEEP